MKYFRALWIYIILPLIFLNNVYALNSNNCRLIDRNKIEHAIKDYLNTTQTVQYEQITVLSKKCSNGYARATLHPKTPIADDAVAYLKIINGKWQVISLGTNFESNFLQKIPQQLRY